jgi:hypothetical protein
MRLGVRTTPWLLAAAGLAIPLAAGGFAGWPYVAGWVIALTVLWIVIRDRPVSRRDRMVLPLILLPVLFVLGIVGGWYLLPADAAWLLVEYRDARDGASITRSAIP